MPTDETADHIQSAFAGLDRLRPAVEAGVPWPLAERFDHAPEASWGPPEVLAHIAEMVSFWDTELSRIATSGLPEPVPFGRLATDADRLATIERERQLPPTQLFDMIATRSATFLAHWVSWTPAERRRLGLHPVRGELSVTDCAERFIAGHVDEHVTQLQGSLGATPADD